MSGPSARPPLVDRRVELEAFRQASIGMARSTSAVLCIEGEIGIGKTRLLQEFASLAGTRGDASLLCRNVRDDQPFSPLIHAETGGALPSLAEMFVQPADDRSGQLIAAVGVAATQRPLWLLVDDLHGADDATRAFVLRLLGAALHGDLRGRSLGIAVSLSTERGADPVRQRLAELDRADVVNRLELRGFTREEVQSWLTWRFATAPHGHLVEILARVSGGNPLLLAELADYLGHRGALCEANGCLDLREGVGELPESLSALLENKRGTISHECRQALTLAAFLGRQFDPGSLARLLRRSESDVERLITEAAAAGLIERLGRTDIVFAHGTAQAYFYDAPDSGQREETHLDIGRRLIGEFGSSADDHCLTITHHLIRAGQRADPEHILRFAAKAGDLACGHQSFFLAGRYFEAAARSEAPSLVPARQAALFWQAGDAYQRWSDGARSDDCFREAIRLYQRSGDLAGQAKALQGVLRNGVAFGEGAGQNAVTADRLKTLLAALPAPGDDLLVHIHDTLAAYYHTIARYDLAESYARTALSIAGSSGDPALRCVPVTSLALAQMEQLRLAEAKSTWLEGLAADRAAGASRYQAYHLQRLPMLLFCMGDVAEAASYSHESHEHARASGYSGETCINLTVDVLIANLRGDFATAVGTGTRAMSLMATTRYRWIATALIGALAYAMTMRGEYDEAEAVIEHLATPGLTFTDTGPYRGTAARLLQLLDAHRDPDLEAPLTMGAQKTAARGVRVGSVGRLCCEAELALLQGRPGRLDDIHDVLEYVHRRGIGLALGWCGSVPRALAASHALRGQWPAALTMFEQAERLADAMAAPLERGRVALYRCLAQLQRGDADNDMARRDLEAAGQAFERFEAPALTRLVERAHNRAVVSRHIN